MQCKDSSIKYILKEVTTKHYKICVKNKFLTIFNQFYKKLLTCCKEKRQAAEARGGTKLHLLFTVEIEAHNDMVQ